MPVQLRSSVRIVDLTDKEFESVCDAVTAHNLHYQLKVVLTGNEAESFETVRLVCDKLSGRVRPAEPTGGQ